MARKDIKGRNLRVGEYYDEKNQRYMFRKMVDGERVTITAASLADLRKQENDLLCKIDKGARFNTKKAKETLNQYFDLITNVKFEFAVFYLGTACILLSSQLMAYVLRYLEAVKGTIFGNVSTAISIIAGVVVLGEPLKAYHIICAALIIVGVLGISLWPEKKTDRIE